MFICKFFIMSNVNVKIHSFKKILRPVLNTEESRMKEPCLSSIQSAKESGFPLSCCLSPVLCILVHLVLENEDWAYRIFPFLVSTHKSSFFVWIWSHTLGDDILFH